MAQKIAVIDDEVDLCKSLGMMLENEGFSVIMAHNGLDGLRLVEKEYPDLIILDLMMPKMSGEEVCKKIRAHKDELVANTPIIMLTAKAEEYDLTKGLVIGATAYMSKPFEWDELYKVIQRTIPGLH